MSCQIVSRVSYDQAAAVRPFFIQLAILVNRLLNYKLPRSHPFALIVVTISLHLFKGFVKLVDASALRAIDAHLVLCPRYRLHVTYHARVSLLRYLSNNRHLLIPLCVVLSMVVAYVVAYMAILLSLRWLVVVIRVVGLKKFTEIPETISNTTMTPPACDPRIPYLLWSLLFVMILTPCATSDNKSHVNVAYNYLLSLPSPSGNCLTAPDVGCLITASESLVVPCPCISCMSI